MVVLVVLSWCLRHQDRWSWWSCLGVLVVLSWWPSWSWWSRGSRGSCGQRGSRGVRELLRAAAAVRAGRGRVRCPRDGPHIPPPPPRGGGFRGSRTPRDVSGEEERRGTRLTRPHPFGCARTRARTRRVRPAAPPGRLAAHVATRGRPLSAADSPARLPPQPPPCAPFTAHDVPHHVVYVCSMCST